MEILGWICQHSKTDVPLWAAMAVKFRLVLVTVLNKARASATRWSILRLSI